MLLSTKYIFGFPLSLKHSGYLIGNVYDASDKTDSEQVVYKSSLHCDVCVWKATI